MWRLYVINTCKCIAKNDKTIWTPDIVICFIHMGVNLYQRGTYIETYSISTYSISQTLIYEYKYMYSIVYTMPWYTYIKYWYTYIDSYTYIKRISNVYQTYIKRILYTYTVIYGDIRDIRWYTSEAYINRVDIRPAYMYSILLYVV